MIGLVVSFSIYLVGGMLYKYKCSGSRGADLIPHYRMWASLPSLVASGCSLFFGMCRRGGSGGGQAKSRGSLEEGLTDDVKDNLRKEARVAA